MNDMIKAVAIAGAREHARLAPHLIKDAITNEVLWMAVARKVIAALRNPTPEMRVRLMQVKLGAGDPVDLYQAVFDAALGEDSWQVPAKPRLVSGA